MTVAPLTAAVLAGVGEGGGHRLGRQQRDRARRRAARHGGGRRGDRLVVRLLARQPPVGRRAGTRGARGRRAKPSGCRSGRPTCTACRPAQAHAVTSAAEAASLHSFHLGMMIAARCSWRSAGSSAWRGSATPSARRSAPSTAPAVSSSARARTSTGRTRSGARAQPTGSRGVGAHRVDDRPEPAPALGQPVLDGRRARGDHGALDQSRRLEVAQALGEHPRARCRRPPRRTR